MDILDDMGVSKLSFKVNYSFKCPGIKFYGICAKPVIHYITSANGTLL